MKKIYITLILGILLVGTITAFTLTSYTLDREETILDTTLSCSKFTKECTKDTLKEINLSQKDLKFDILKESKTSKEIIKVYNE